MVVAGIPAEECKHVDHRLGQVATFAVAAAELAGFGVVPVEREHGETQTVAISFAQFAVAVGFEQEGQVCELGHSVLPTEGTIEHHVQGGGGEPFLAADDVGDFHRVVVDDVGKMISGHTVRFEKHLVVEEVAVHGNVAADKVVHGDVDIVGELEAYHVWLTAVDAPLHFVGGE